MKPTKELRRKIFKENAEALKQYCPDQANQMLCPLCLEPFDEAAAVAGVIVAAEHIIPDKLGGDAFTLTCKRCNNEQGSEADSHLVKAMKALDGWEGKGSLRGTFNNAAGHVAVNFTTGFWTEGTTEIKVVGGAASDPRAVQATRSMFYDGAELSFTLHYGFVQEKYWRAVLRVGYLAIFQRLGYGYVLSNGGSQVRHILDSASPQQGIVLEAYPSATLPSPLLILPVGNERASFYLVIMRLKSAVTRHCSVFLPHAAGCDWSVLHGIASNPEQMIAETIPEDSSRIFLRFGCDPIAVLREPLIPAGG